MSLMKTFKYIIWIFFISMVTLHGGAGHAYGNTEKSYHVNNVLCLTLQGSINPGTKELYLRAIKNANKIEGGMLLVLLDTPGGLVTSLRDMVQATMDSEAPVVVFVYPPGAQAASAGAILTLSAHVAVMAPGTNIGAAHPVAIGLPKKDQGGDETLTEKAVNDIAAMARSIAQEMGRNATWAEMAVRKSISATAMEAFSSGVIDIIAKGPEELLKKLDGHHIRLKGVKVRMEAPSPIIQEITPTLREKVLAIIADPNVAYVLMMIGIVGLYFELAHPGTIFPGAIGGISLLLGLYALQALPVSAIGLMLIILGAVLFALELFVMSHGVLGVFGLLSLILGSIMLFNVEGGGIGLSLSVLIPTLVTVGGGMFAILFLAARATLSEPLSGTTALIGKHGTVKEVINDGQYLVFLHGELWLAKGPPGMKEGSGAIVKEMEGLSLKIEPIKQIREV